MLSVMLVISGVFFGMHFGGRQVAQAAIGALYTPYLHLEQYSGTSGWNNTSAAKCNTQAISANGNYEVELTRTNLGATANLAGSQLGLLCVCFPRMAADLGITHKVTDTTTYAARKTETQNAGVSFTNVTLYLNGAAYYTFSDTEVMYGDLLSDGSMCIMIFQRNVDSYASYSNPQTINNMKGKNPLLTTKVKVSFTINVSSWGGSGLVQTKGDANGDGHVDNKDILMIRKYMADPVKNPLTAQQFLNADVNVDGNVDNKDLIKVRKYYADPVKNPL